MRTIPYPLKTDSEENNQQEAESFLVERVKEEQQEVLLPLVAPWWLRQTPKEPTVKEYCVAHRHKHVHIYAQNHTSVFQAELSVLTEEAGGVYGGAEASRSQAPSAGCQRGGVLIPLCAVPCCLHCEFVPRDKICVRWFEGREAF